MKKVKYIFNRKSHWQFLILIALMTSFCFLSAQSDCLAFQGNDETNKRLRLDTQSKLLFAYTSETIKPYLNRDMMLCESNITYLQGGYYVLNLIFDIALANAPKTYGYIPSRSSLVIYFLDGKKIDLKNTDDAIGKYDIEKEVFRYKVEYPIDGTSLKHLKIKGLDKIIITWSTGIETYDIYDIDFYIHQFECLSKYQ